MNSFYGWTYAGRLNVAVRRNSRRNSYLPQRRKTQKLNSAPAPRHGRQLSLGRSGRIVVAVLLVMLSLIVMGKEASLRASVEQAVINGWRELQQVLGWEGKQTVLNSVPDAAVREDVTMATTDKLESVAWVLDKNLFALDKKGGVWSLPDDAMPADLPVITGLVVREEPGKMGMRLQVDYNTVLIQKILNTPYIGQLSEIHLGSPAGVILYTRDGIKVLLQNSPDLDRDLKRLGAVIGDIRVKEKRIALVDLRYSRHVVVRPKHRR